MSPYVRPIVSSAAFIGLSFLEQLADVCASRAQSQCGVEEHLGLDWRGYPSGQHAGPDAVAPGEPQSGKEPEQAEPGS